jgi:hypothetical protein
VTLPGPALDALQTLVGQVARCHGERTYVRSRYFVKAETTRPSVGPDRDVHFKVDYRDDPAPGTQVEVSKPA